MVKIHQIQRAAAGETPVMPTHRLEALKDTRTFKKGEQGQFWINKMTDGRFGVTDADFSRVTKHYEVFTEDELHSSFNET